MASSDLSPQGMKLSLPCLTLPSPTMYLLTLMVPSEYITNGTQQAYVSFSLSQSKMLCAGRCVPDFSFYSFIWLYFGGLFGGGLVLFCFVWAFIYLLIY